MQTNCPVKQEQSNPSSYSQLYTMPPSPRSSKPEDPSFGDWSFVNAAPSTFESSFQFHPTSSYTAGSERDDSQPARMLYPSPSTDLSAMLFLDQPLQHSPTSVFTSSPQKSSRVHVPRPPNAFMLYRSDFLKRGIIPSHVERRQQNLSRIAGQCWNLLPPEEKAQWQDRAAQVLNEHQKRNPDYKFTPAPRGSRRPKVKGRFDGDVEAVEGEERIRQIREEYARIAGPTASPARRRRPRVQNRSRDLDKEQAKESPLSQAAKTPLPPSIPPSPSLSSPGHECREEPPLPPFFPQYSFPNIVPPRRPSTSLGFSAGNALKENASARAGFNLTRPSSAASETGLTGYLKELDLTPTVATFGSISSSSSPVSSLQTSYSNPEIEIPSPTVNVTFPMTYSMEQDPEASGHRGDCFLGLLYSGEPFHFNLPPFPAQQDYPLLDDSYLFDNYDPSTFHEGWYLDTSLVDATKSYSL